MSASVTAYRVTTNSEVTKVEFPTGKSYYDVAREMLGDWAEMVRVLRVGPEDILVIFVDESGLLKRLPTNPLASRFYPAPGSPAHEARQKGILVGDAVFVQMHFSQPPDEPDWEPVEMNEHCLAALRSAGVLVS